MEMEVHQEILQQFLRFSILQLHLFQMNILHSQKKRTHLQIIQQQTLPKSLLQNRHRKKSPQKIQNRQIRMRLLHNLSDI